jgi:hypothetical protein
VERRKGVGSELMFGKPDWRRWNDCTIIVKMLGYRMKRCIVLTLKVTHFFTSKWMASIKTELAEYPGSSRLLTPINPHSPPTSFHPQNLKPPSLQSTHPLPSTSSIPIPPLHLHLHLHLQTHPFSLYFFLAQQLAPTPLLHTAIPPTHNFVARRSGGLPLSYVCETSYLADGAMIRWGGRWGVRCGLLPVG